MDSACSSWPCIGGSTSNVCSVPREESRLKDLVRASVKVRVRVRVGSYLRVRIRLGLESRWVRIEVSVGVRVGVRVRQQVEAPREVELQCEALHAAGVLSVHEEAAAVGEGVHVAAVEGASRLATPRVRAQGRRGVG